MDAYITKDNGISIDADELVQRLNAVAARMSVASEWARRLDVLETKREGAK